MKLFKLEEKIEKKKKVWREKISKISKIKFSYLVLNWLFSRTSLTVTIRSSLMLSFPPGTEGSQGLVRILGATGEGEGSGAAPPAATAAAAVIISGELALAGLQGW
jgi:hypothetical protein